MIKLKELCIEPEHFETDILSKIPEQYISYSQMTHGERLFLNGMIRLAKPKNILEVGVCTGGGSCIILNAIEDDAEAKLISIDIEENVLGLPCGFAAKELYPNSERFNLFCSKDAVEVLEGLNTKFDFVVLDTAHYLPGEVLHFLALFPFLTEDAIVVLHDISFHTSENDPMGQSCALLFSSIVADKKIGLLKDFDITTSVFPNIGAFQITKETPRHIENLFHSLRLPWYHRLSDKYECLYIEFIRKYYNEYLSELFNHSLRINNVKTSDSALKKSLALVKEYREFSENGKLIFYGAPYHIIGHWLHIASICGVAPSYVWDIKANEKNIIGKQEVSLPDWNIFDEDTDYLVILFLTSKRNIDDVTAELNCCGVQKIIHWKDFTKALNIYNKHTLQQG